MKNHLIQLFSAILFTITFSFFKRTLVRRIPIKMETNGAVWSQAFLHSISKPLNSFIWFTVLIFSLQLIQDQTIASLLPLVHKMGALLMFMWAALRFIDKFETFALSNKNNKYNTIRITQFLRVSAFVIGAIGFLQLLNIPLSGLLAFGGIGGIAIGFAAKDLFANFFGGFMVFLDQPFQIGDLIRSTNQEIEGTVEKIGWRLTQIRTPNKSLIFVPNALFSTIIVENSSQMNGRKMQTKFILSYTDTLKARQIIAEIRNLLKNHPEIDQAAPYFANLIHFSPFGLEISIQAYTKKTETLQYQMIQEDLFFSILQIVKSYGAHLYRSNLRDRFLTASDSHRF